MDQEAAERQLAKTENILNRTTNKLAANGTGEEKRAWFQTPKERFNEKQRLAVSEEAMNNGKPANAAGQKRKGGKDGAGGHDSKKKKRAELTPEQQAEERVKRELQKVAQVQAKFSKAKQRLNRLRAVDEEVDQPKAGGGTGKKAGKKDRVIRSNFDKDLTDVSDRAAKKFRYQATKAKNEFARNKAKGRPSGGAPGSKGKTSNVKIANKAGMNKFNRGKNFGGPKQSKKTRK